MKLKFKNHSYEVYLKPISEIEREDLISRISIIPKSLNRALVIYIDNLMYYLNSTYKVICIKAEEKEIICLKLENSKEEKSIKCIGIDVSEDKNRVNLNFLILKDLEEIIEDKEKDEELMMHPILISFL